MAVACAETWLILWEHIAPLPLTPFTVVGVALGLLLTLRTNASYDRFWEGRKAWGMIVNRSRNLSRQLAALFSSTEIRKSFATLITAFSENSKRQLWGETTSGNPLLQLSQEFESARKAGILDSMDLIRLEADLAVLIDQIGICERIQRTPIPIGYVLHMHRFLVVFCLTLPLALAQDLQWVTPLAVGFMGYAFLGIEQIGVEIEDPFERTPNDLDLEGITRRIREDVEGILR